MNPSDCQESGARVTSNLNSVLCFIIPHFIRNDKAQTVIPVLVKLHLKGKTVTLTHLNHIFHHTVAYLNDI